MSFEKLTRRELQEFVVSRHENGKSRQEIIGAVFDNFGSDAAKEVSEILEFLSSETPNSAGKPAESESGSLYTLLPQHRTARGPIGLAIAGSITGIIFSIPILYMGYFASAPVLIAGILGLLGGAWGFTNSRGARALLVVSCVVTFFLGPMLNAILLLIPLGLFEAHIRRET